MIYSQKVSSCVLSGAEVVKMENRLWISFYPNNPIQIMFLLLFLILFVRMSLNDQNQCSNSLSQSHIHFNEMFRKYFSSIKSVQIKFKKRKNQ